MDDENCEEEKKQELLHDQFSQELDELLEKYSGNLNSIDLTCSLILEAKIEMCCVSPDFMQMYGILTHILSRNLEEMWNEMKPKEEE